VHGLHYNLCDKAGLGAYIDSAIGADWRTLSDNDDPKNGLYILRKALAIVISHDSMADMLRAVVNSGPGQDTDTLGGLALSIASRSREVADDLPDSLFDELEKPLEDKPESAKKRGDYGREFLASLDRALQRRFPGISAHPSVPRPQFGVP
jgi:hypothetical protein